MAITARRRKLLWSLLLVGAVFVVVAALVFEPWKAFIDRRVDEAPPVAAGPGPASAVIARGTLVAHEHDSSGTVEVVRLPDGARVLRLQDLRTSDGPKLEVWLADAPVLPGRDGWFVFDDGRHVDLGPLKGNIGSSNYPIPADIDLTALSSVTIWCDRFNVSFAAAALRPA
jgi:electron transfer DM13